jgi:methyl-accepting chemotaxis protein
MGAIAESSREIAKIIKVIDEIAFQTNLLALNAAVEAARAGQHGRGFAVVAQEVRNLAGRSAKAAKETAELIDDAGRRVADGVKVAGETSTALNEIVQNVTKVKDLAGEIASASEEQSKGLAQINVAMLQVNQGAQASSQQSEELASTADELGNLADRLREEAARFKLQEQKGFSDGMGGMLPTGITPEIMRQIVEMGRQQNATSAQPKATTPQPVIHKQNGKKVDLPLPMDRDKRGYGQF